MLNPICPLLAVPGDEEDEDEGMQKFDESPSIPFLQDRVSDRPVTDRLSV